MANDCSLRCWTAATGGPEGGAAGWVREVASLKGRGSALVGGGGGGASVGDGEG